MLTGIQIKNFRSFSNVEIGPFKRINLIAGLNNTGKTALLEAIFIVLGVQDRRQRAQEGRNQPEKLPNVFRVFSPQADENRDFWLWLFRDKNQENDIQIWPLIDGELKEGITLTTRHPNTFERVKSGHLRHLGNLGQFLFCSQINGPSDCLQLFFLRIRRIQFRMQSTITASF